MQFTESILIVDDEKTIRMIWADALESQGYTVFQAGNPEEAITQFGEHQFGLALVDLKMASSMDGLELLGWIKENHNDVDVIMITAYATLDTSIVALRQGAYDYLVKPVSIAEVISSVDRCMNKRREVAERLQIIGQIEMMLVQLKKQIMPKQEEISTADRILETPSLIVDRRKRLVVLNGEPVALSPTEFDMLDYLVTHSDRVVTASELIRAVQGYDMDEMDARPIVRVNIRRLRQKVEEDTNNPRHIITVRSRGYRFAG